MTCRIITSQNNQNFEQQQKRKLKRLRKTYKPTKLETRTKVNEKENPPEPPLKNTFAKLQPFAKCETCLCSCIWFCFSAKHLTASVSGGQGAGVDESLGAEST
jgi:hypothetical protein